MHDVHMKRKILRYNNQYKCHSKSWVEHAKDKTCLSFFMLLPLSLIIYVYIRWYGQFFLSKSLSKIIYKLGTKMQAIFEKRILQLRVLFQKEFSWKDFDEKVQF